MLLRATAIAFVLLLAGQAFAAGDRVMVCRFTGKVMAKCPCPGSSEETQLKRASCCEIVASEPFAPQALIRQPAQLPAHVDVVWALPELGVERVVAAADRHALPLAQAPPDEHGRYLKLLHLLN